MESIEYAIAYSEVLEILKHIPLQDYNKIPEDKIKIFKENAKKDYEFEYNPNISLKEQNVSKRGRAIIAILFRDYWCTDIQREKIISKQNKDRIEFEEAKKQKYNSDNLFKEKMDTSKRIKETITEEVDIVEYKESIFRKIWNKILNIFK